MLSVTGLNYLYYVRMIFPIFFNAINQRFIDSWIRNERGVVELGNLLP